MAGDRRGLTQRQIRTLFDVGTVAGLTDGQLLERFATRRDEGAELAFAALVERHGPMVLQACRGILRDDHEAMDVFQATFLVLARKGETLWVRDSLGPWLHRVACRAAGRARSAAARRRTIETTGAAMADARSGGVDDCKELVSIIHEEVDRLPERYRSPVVLCDLEGCTCEEAARHLGCPVGTVASRLARARQRLRARLRRRGLAPNASLLAAAMRWQGPGASISAELVGSTARAAVQFVSIGAVTHGSAASLASEVIRSMAMTYWWKLASLLIVLGASASGVVAFAGKEAVLAEPGTTDPPEAPRADDVAGLVVKPGNFRVNVVERGTVESARNQDVFCLVEGRTTIISILPEGTKVKKGDLVCELDSAALKDQLTNQFIAMSGAEGAYQNAKVTREVTEIALAEYEIGNYPQWLQAATGEIALARSAITTAEERLKRTRIARDRVKALLDGQGGMKTPADVVAVLEVDDRLDDAQQSLDRERRALQIAEAKRDVLEKFTKDKTVKQLRSDVEKARADELAKERTWDLETKKKLKLERQIASCKLLAPGDGLVVYANDPSRFGGSNQPQIEEGAVVRERQKIFSLPDTSHMQVNTKVHESIIAMISPGLPATVTVDAFPGQSLTGIVVDIAPLPDANAFFNRDVNVYSTRVSIREGVPGLRPGMTAKVDILVAELEGVLSVPTQAVVWYDQKDHVAVKTADNTVEWREVTLGLSDGKRVEVKAGLKSGETVVLDPDPLLTEEQRRKLSDSPPKPVAKPKATATGKAKTKGVALPAALRTKLETLGPEDRVKLREASPAEREALFKKAGLTDDEIRQLNSLRPQSSTPR